MSEADKRLEIVLEIIPNPPGQADPHPYHIELTNTSTDETLEADFSLDQGQLKGWLKNESPQDYGEYLFQQVFEESVDEDGHKGSMAERLRNLLKKVVNDEHDELVLRLEIAQKLVELRSLAWEAAFNAAEKHTLAADSHMTFYRDVNVDTARPSEPIQGKLRVLIAVICPEQPQLNALNEMLRAKGEIQEDLQPLPVAEEKERLDKLFKTLRAEVTSIFLEPDPEQGPLSTLDLLADALQDGKFHILHLSCHGLVLHTQKKPVLHLLLLDENGQPDLVSDEAFAEVFRNKLKVRLVLLDACHSAEVLPSGGYSGLVPRLLKRVPAVIGMQRQWYSGTLDDKFCTIFYKELSDHGYIDRALQRARQHLFRRRSEHWDWSTPVLYQHLGKGRLFQPEQPGPLEGMPTPELYGGFVGVPGKPAGGGTYRGWKGQGYQPVKRTAHGQGPLEYAGLPPSKDIGEGEAAEEESGPPGIYQQAVLAQEGEKFGRSKQRRARQELLAYYEQQRAALQERLGQPGADPKRLQAQIEDLDFNIRELKDELG